MSETTEQRICSAIEELRKDEGDTVTIVCDNPELTGPNSLIYCNGEWTGWEDRDFIGDNIVEALEDAVQARKEAEVDP